MTTYENGAVWIDSVDGTAGTTINTNGTITNPVASLADALALATQLKLKRFEVAPGSVLTLSADLVGYSIDGDAYTLDANGFNMPTVVKGATVIGTETGSGESNYYRCLIGNGSEAFTLKNGSSFNHCGMIRVVFPSDESCRVEFPFCYSHIIDNTNEHCEVDLNATGPSHVAYFPGFQGSLFFNNLMAGDNMLMSGSGLMTAYSLSGGDLAVAGNFQTYVVGEADQETLNGNCERDTVQSWVWDAYMIGHTKSLTFGKHVQETGDTDAIATALREKLAALIVWLSSPHDQETGELKLVASTEYKTGGPLGPLSFKLANASVAASDAVRFVAQLSTDNGTEQIDLSGTVTLDGSDYFATFEIDAADLDVNPSVAWRYSVLHGTGPAAIIADQPLAVLPSRLPTA